MLSVAELPDVVPVSYTHLDVYKRQERAEEDEPTAELLNHKAAGNLAAAAKATRCV